MAENSVSMTRDRSLERARRTGRYDLTGGKKESAGRTWKGGRRSRKWWMNKDASSSVLSVVSIVSQHLLLSSLEFCCSLFKRTEQKKWYRMVSTTFDESGWCPIEDPSKRTSVKRMSSSSWQRFHGGIPTAAALTLRSSVAANQDKCAPDGTAIEHNHDCGAPRATIRRDIFSASLELLLYKRSQIARASSNWPSDRQLQTTSWSAWTSLTWRNFALSWALITWTNQANLLKVLFFPLFSSVRPQTPYYYWCLRLAYQVK